MLRYNTYDRDRDIHINFYNHLNSLNGDGYPHTCRNIGVAFSTNTENPNLGVWMIVKRPFEDTEFYIKPGDAWKEAGSYLSKGLTFPWGYTLFWIWEMVRVNNPTYIPHKSALDIVNGKSKLDVTISSATHHYHLILLSLY